MTEKFSKGGARRPTGGTPRRETLALWIALARATRHLSDVARSQVAEHDLTLTEFGVLEAIEHRGPARMCELQRRILVSSGGITFVVDRLDERGLVERRPDPDDRRARRVFLTGKGKALVERVLPDHLQSIADALSSLSPAQQRQALKLLRSIARPKPREGS